MKILLRQNPCGSIQGCGVQDQTKRPSVTSLFKNPQKPIKESILDEGDVDNEDGDEEEEDENEEETFVKNTANHNIVLLVLNANSRNPPGCSCDNAMLDMLRQAENQIDSNNEPEKEKVNYRYIGQYRRVDVPICMSKPTCPLCQKRSLSATKSNISDSDKCLPSSCERKYMCPCEIFRTYQNTLKAIIPEDGFQECSCSRAPRKKLKKKPKIEELPELIKKPVKKKVKKGKQQKKGTDKNPETTDKLSKSRKSNKSRNSIIKLRSSGSTSEKKRKSVKIAEPKLSIESSITLKTKKKRKKIK